jgi:transposase
MTFWAKPPAPRHQLVLISQTLDDAIAEDHPIRLLDALLDQIDWRPWEARYDGHRGQPPIHPKRIAGAILYGLIKRIRSSRELEDATRERLDFKWLLGGRTIDHSTFAAFRTQFAEELKDLNKQIARKVVAQAKAQIAAQDAGQSEATALLEAILDGTRVRANSDRNGARSAAGLEKLIAACAEQLNLKLAQLAGEDVRDEEVQALRQEVARIEEERDKYRAALEEAQKRDAIKRSREGAKSRPVRVPVTDPASTILPNKEGGFAPNYTPTAAVESQSGAIISADVVPGGDEGQAVATAVADFEEVLGRKPDRMSADGNFASGPNLELLEKQNVEIYMPVGADLSEKNPANRPDPSQPVAEERRGELPRHGKQLDKNAFVYDPAKDEYRCPMGKPLLYEKSSCCQRTGITQRIYACPGKEGCPLADVCVKGEADHRTLSRDEYQEIRDRVAQEMASEAGRAIYRKRAPAIEGVFGVIKQSLGVRQFLLRGLDKVRIEWRWVCGAYNVKKMLRLMQTQQAGSGA